jgi:FtsH-binding integral membrane protein
MNNTISVKQAKPEVQQRFMAGVYRWMVLALAISGIAAYASAYMPLANGVPLVNVIFSAANGMGMWVLIIAELVLVFTLSARIGKMSMNTAKLMFLAYSLVNGITLSVIFLVYTSTSISKVFLISALLFGSMSIYGTRTKNDLTAAGRYLMMAVFGLIIASIINILLKSGGLDWLISIIAVVVFTGLTAYDTQKLMRISQYNDGSENFQKVAIIGALQLYLDFINIFLHLLRLFGNRN